MFALSVVAVQPCAARLGETEAELVQRLGEVGLRADEEVIEKDHGFVVGERLHFAAGGWNIAALMIDGRCERIAYQRLGEWNDEQFTYLLNANVGGFTWHATPSRTPKKRREWRRDDGTLAIWSPLTGMVIASPTYEKVRAAIRDTARRTSTRLSSL